MGGRERERERESSMMSYSTLLSLHRVQHEGTLIKGNKLVTYIASTKWYHTCAASCIEYFIINIPICIRDDVTIGKTEN